MPSTCLSRNSHIYYLEDAEITLRSDHLPLKRFFTIKYIEFKGK